MMKRTFDLLFSIVGLLTLLPFFPVIATIIKLDSEGPVFFRQERVGRYGGTFRIFKFRTMEADAEKRGVQVSRGDDRRITRAGRFLRKYKLDELPQLLNVITGEMSLVGPRPEVPRYVQAFKLEYEEILKVRPGITDFASLEYRHEGDLLRDAENPEEKYLRDILPAKIEYYRKYLKEQSIVTDTSIILKTILKIFG